VRRVVDTGGRLDVVVNNAGTFATGPLEAFTIEQARQQFETNVFGALRINRALLPGMRMQGHALLIQVSSVLGQLALPFLGLYSATKFALEGLTEAYHQELAPRGIDAVLVEPGTYPTALGAKRTTAADAPRLPAYGPSFQSFLGQFAAAATAASPDPQEVADAIVGIVATPAGARPLRTVVAPPGQGDGPTILNAAAERAAHALRDGMGLRTGMPAHRAAGRPGRVLAATRQPDRVVWVVPGQGYRRPPQSRSLASGAVRPRGGYALPPGTETRHVMVLALARCSTWALRSLRQGSGRRPAAGDRERCLDGQVGGRRIDTTVRAIDARLASRDRNHPGAAAGRARRPRQRSRHVSGGRALCGCVPRVSPLSPP
jgi:NADP-dependent 3-hydroxy acid dehydrogenase YdfG